MKTFPRINPEHILEASQYIHPAFLDTPYFYSGLIGDPLEIELYLKVETLNPLRSFKGRGCDYFFATMGEGIKHVACASLGNFGQGIAYAAQERNCLVTIFAPVGANPLKVERMESLGGKVVLQGIDFEEAKREAEIFARESGAFFVADGGTVAISEGAGTIASEIAAEGKIDCVVVPIGNGSLVNGIGTYFKHCMPEVKVIGVVAKGAPSVLQSHKKHKVVATEKVETIADGIAIRKPIDEAFFDMEAVVDEIWQVEDAQIVEAMRLLAFKAGLVAEPAGAVALAGVVFHHHKLKGRKVAALVTGANISERQFQNLLTRV